MYFPDSQTITVSKDEGIRGSTTLESLSKLKPAFKADGTATAGNSSQVSFTAFLLFTYPHFFQTSDGAAVVVAMTRAEAKRRGLPILGRFLSYAVSGVPPAIMGVGPRYAIPPALEKAGLTYIFFVTHPSLSFPLLVPPTLTYSKSTKPSLLKPSGVLKNSVST